MDHRLRRERLAARLPELGIEALLVTRLPNVRYLTGFTGSNGQLLATANGSVFFTDGRYTTQSEHEVPDLERVTYSSGFAATAAEAARGAGVSSMGFEASGVTYRFYQELAEGAKGLTLVPIGEEVERFRWAKDPMELELVGRAQAATDEAFEEILPRLALGMTERIVALELEKLIRRAGADGLAFDTVVAFGENAAEPHHEPNHRVLQEGDVVKMDFGAVCEGYHSDMTRTVAFGEPPAELLRIYEIVKQAQLAGVEAVRAGVVGKDADRAARTIIEDAGYGERYTHSLGHGVGLEVHEGPNLRSISDEELPAGAVVTVEPGIYVPGLGGVRIEDMVEVTDAGCRVIPRSTKELVIL